MSRARATALGVLALLAAACSSDALTVPVGSFCSSDLDCDPDQSCHRGQCLSGIPTSVAGLDIEITPDDRGRLSRVQLLDQTLDASREAVLEVPAPALFRTFKVFDARTSSTIAARVTFRGYGRIPTREVDTTVLLDADRDTSLALLPDTYDVRVLPASSLLAGMEIRGFVVQSTATVSRRDLVIDSARHARVSGDVSRRTSNQIKIQGVQVQARSLQTGMPSTLATTDTDGRYDIILPNTTDTTYVLTAQPLPGAGVQSWTFSQTITVPPGTSRDVPIPLEETTDEVRGTLRLRVLGMDDGAPAPVADARVVLTALTGLDYRTLVLEGVTDDQGALLVGAGPTPSEIPVLAARYAVRVEPPPGSAWRTSTRELDLTGALNNVVIDKQVALERKIEVRGLVVSNQGQPVIDARVRIEAVQSGVPVVTAVTDARGAYRALVDPGHHLVTVTPTPNSKVGEALPVGFGEISIDAAAGAPVEVAPIYLAVGALVRGRARDNTGTALPRADVEVFRRIVVRIDGADVVRVMSLGRVTTASDGTFSIVLPGA